MIETFVEKTLRRDRLITLAAIAIIALIAWVYIILLSGRMSAGSATASDMEKMGMAMPELSWDMSRFLLTFVMWAVMMVAMMLPSAAPFVLLYARVGRAAAASGTVFASTFWFAAGYSLAWAGFSAFATLAQFGLSQAALITPMAGLSSRGLGALVLTAAGLYQWTPLKQTCLRRCRTPLSFIQSHGGFKGETAASVGLGFWHGLYCIGCCWMLMALLFVGGVMNLLWIAALAILVLMEKLLPSGAWVARFAGVGFVAAAVWLLLAH